MTTKEIAALFDKHSDEYLCFDRIPRPERRHHLRDVSAFLLLAKLAPEHTGDAVGSAAHDEICLAVGPEDVPSITEADVIELLRCGVLFSYQYESFRMNV